MFHCMVKIAKAVKTNGELQGVVTSGPSAVADGQREHEPRERIADELVY